jgi:hypothetical protein
MLTCGLLQAQFGTPVSGGTASGFDSTSVGRDSSRVQFTFIDGTEQGSPSLRRNSYSLNNFQFYLPVYANQIINSSLGNNGNAVQNLNFNPKFTRGFNQGFNAFNTYYLPLEQTKFYDAQSPYTEAFYVQGSKEEAFFRLSHTQNAGKKVNFGLEYQRINSLGYFSRQTAQHSAIRLHTWLRPGNERYQAMIALSYHKGSSLENGGITNVGDSLYQSGVESNLQLYPVSLPNARTDIFNNGLMLRHFFDLVPEKKDSNGIVTQNRIVRLQLTHQYDFNKYTYFDDAPQADFYPSITDTLRSNSNYTQVNLENEVAILFLKSKTDSLINSGIEAKGFIRSQSINYSNNFIINNPNSYSLATTNLSTGGFIRLNLKEWLSLNAHTEVFFAGFNAGDLLLQATLRGKPLKNISLEAGLRSFSQEAPYQMQFYLTNFSSWQNEQSKINQLKLYGKLELIKQKLSLEASNFIIGNYIYLDENQNPNTISSALNVLRVHLKHELRIGKWGLNSQILLQQANNENVVRLPLIQFREGIFREGLISSSTPWRIGVDFIGCSAFFANSYAPYLGQFFIQNNKKNAGFVQANLYLSAKIKRARFFAMLEHANSNLFDQRADILPFYPLPNRLLKLGLNWVFFD